MVFNAIFNNISVLSWRSDLLVESEVPGEITLSSGDFLNEAPLGLFIVIYDYLPYFEKIDIFFNIIAKKVRCLI
jgi:hypothetical protein